MLKKDLILRNPLRRLEDDSQAILPRGGLGAVLARAGVGKTAFLVQLALNRILNNRNVLHISLDDPVSKVSLWYEEVVHHLADRYDIPQLDQIWEVILPHRFIMSFQAEGFSVPKLEERLNDLTEQNIFVPQLILIDGLPVEAEMIGEWPALKDLAAACGARIWCTVRTHRHEECGTDGIPLSLQQNAALCEAIIQLQPENEDIHVRVLKGGQSVSGQPSLLLDPTTMLIREATPQD